MMIPTTILLLQGATPTDRLSLIPERRDRHSICGYTERGLDLPFVFF